MTTHVEMSPGVACGKPTSHLVEVEVVQREESKTTKNCLERKVVNYLRKSGRQENLVQTQFQDNQLDKDVASLEICLEQMIDLSKSKFKVFIFRLNNDGPEEEDISGGDGEEVTAATVRKLPSADLQGLWNSLIFDTGIKKQLVKYVETSLELARHGVDINLVGINRVALLHGPPGTGKTSLCKALANKLAVRMGDTFSQGFLVEINSHSLFSKWFSESGKLVQAMFDSIKRMVMDKSNFVVVLIDEVESLTSARKNASSGLECSDAIRVVNALLTQIDSIKTSPNVLVLTTSNITGQIDLAFVDRADIKQYVGPPTKAAIYTIYMSAINELLEKEVLRSGSDQLFSHNSQTSRHLWQIADQSAGFSGRTLRKLPFLALSQVEVWGELGLDMFLDLLEGAVGTQRKDREMMGHSHNTA